VLKESRYKQAEKKALYPKPRIRGRNNYGVITCRHRGGGHKRFYRKIDFLRGKLNCIGYIRTIEYDPNRNAYISLVSYKDGTKGYILFPKNLKIGEMVTVGFRTPVRIGNVMPLWNIPLGMTVHNVELNPNSGGKVSRSAGTSVQLIARDNGYVTLRLPSGEIRLVYQTCWATIGQVGNLEARNKKLKKAGNRRWCGFRPVVRGSAINPVDHPHGGGEGRCPIGRIPVTPWGKPRLGVKTRSPKKYSNIFILRKGKSYFIYFYASIVEEMSFCCKVDPTSCGKYN
jgi:large subunit ribosomal protein L2